MCQPAEHQSDIVFAPAGKQPSVTLWVLGCAVSVGIDGSTRRVLYLQGHGGTIRRTFLRRWLLNGVWKIRKPFQVVMGTA